MMIKNTGTKVENTPQQSKFPTYKKPSCHVPLLPLTGETDNKDSICHFGSKRAFSREDFCGKMRG